MQDNIQKDDLAIFFDAAKAEDLTLSTDLMARVLADAAEVGAEYVKPVPVEVIEKPSWLKQLFAPIGGMAGAFALGTFASIGLIVGFSDTETLYSLPVMGDILATFTNGTGAGSPIDTLSYLMAES